MQNVFFQTICRVGIFMICAQAIIHFRPQEAYEKYLKLLVSIMVLIQLFLPVGSFLLGGGGQEAAELLEQFKGELEQNMEEAQRRAAEAEAVLERMTLEELRRQLEEQRVQGGEAGERGELRRQLEEQRVQDGEAGERGEDGYGTGAIGVEEVEVDVEPVEPISVGEASG